MKLVQVLEWITLKKQLTLHFIIQEFGMDYPKTTINWENMETKYWLMEFINIII